jgi:hypothetical protein
VADRNADVILPPQYGIDVSTTGQPGPPGPQGPPGIAGVLTQIITTSQTVTAPEWATILEVTLYGGGAGGGGAGSALTTGGVANQAGGNGGFAGGVGRRTFTGLDGSPVPVTVGAGGVGGVGGALNGNPGLTTSGPGRSSVNVKGVVYQSPAFQAGTSSLGAPSGANTGASTNASIPWSGGALGASWSAPPGTGGVNGYPGGPAMGDLHAGGGGGNAASATNGGGGGRASTLGGPGAGGAAAASTTANGLNGDTATDYGCGGGGGGGGAPGGVGGNGGNGAPGAAILVWRAA